MFGGDAAGAGMATESHAGTTSVVLGVETQIGLSIIRELGEAGVHVIAVTTDARSVGAASRHAREVIAVRALRSPATLKILNEIAQRCGGCSLLTVSEANINWLLAHREQLASGLRPALPSAVAFRTVTNKDLTLKLASAVGIDVPFSEEPRSFEHFRAIAAKVGYPVVLKWGPSEGFDVAALLEREQLPLLKAEYAHDEAELLAIGQRYQRIGCFPLIQEYCAGQGFGQFFYMHGGEAVRRFQHLRVAEWPPEGGFSSVCDVVPLAQYKDLQEKSIALLNAVGWSGVAMVEYRVDPASGRARLMEINGRFWGSFPLAYHAGAGFALLAHRDALGLSLEGLPASSDRLRCRMVLTEVKRLVRLLFHPSMVQDRQFRIRPLRELLRFCMDFARPRVCYYVWSWRDPKPWLADMSNSIRKLVAR